MTAPPVDMLATIGRDAGLGGPAAAAALIEATTAE